jgi:hypothetical protein
MDLGLHGVLVLVQARACFPLHYEKFVKLVQQGRVVELGSKLTSGPISIFTHQYSGDRNKGGIPGSEERRFDSSHCMAQKCTWPRGRSLGL